MVVRPLTAIFTFNGIAHVSFRWSSWRVDDNEANFWCRRPLYSVRWRHAGVWTSNLIEICSKWQICSVLKLFPVLSPSPKLSINFTCGTPRIKRHRSIQCNATSLNRVFSIVAYRRWNIIIPVRWHHAGVEASNPVEGCS